MAKGGFRGGMGGGSMMKLQKMQEEFLKMQQELENTEFVAQAGGGAVKATMMGTRVLKSVEIDPEAVDPEDVEMLQDMIVASINEAIAQADAATNAAMSKLSPLGMGLPF